VASLALVGGLAVWLVAGFVAPAATSTSTSSTTAATTAATTATTTAAEGASPEASAAVLAAVSAPPDTGAAEPEVSVTEVSATEVSVTEPPAAPAAELAPLPVCAYGSEPAPHAGALEWRLTLLDTTFRLSSDYVPEDLVNVQAALAVAAPGAQLAAAGHELRAEAANALSAMFAAAEAAGVQLAVQSAYRSYAYQASTFDYWVELQGHQAALRTSARAGHSEHQLGTAVDLRSRGGPAAWDLDDWALTPEGAWAGSNAHAFGFVMSYPAGAEAISCYDYEPWHFRYVGAELAAAIHAAGEVPREFLWRRLQEQASAGAAPESNP